ncbi:MAG: hypothetical protein J1F63_00615 [Oscillospiraceae bacterium]|nr:hypothetical protein [Oscillospiraceae bacterium]
MPKYDSQRKASKKWRAENLEYIQFSVRKGEKARIKAYAEGQNQTLAGFIKDTIYSAMSASNEDFTE